MIGTVRLDGARIGHAQLAHDYDRWGLAAEAEAVRRRYRDGIVRDLLDKALSSLPRDRRRSSRAA